MERLDTLRVTFTKGQLVSELAPSRRPLRSARFTSAATPRVLSEVYYEMRVSGRLMSTVL